MTTLISTGDFIKLEYTGKDQSGKVFDSTEGDIARTLHAREGPILVIYGHDLLVAGLHEVLPTLPVGQLLEITVPPEKGFGMRSPNHIKVIGERELAKHDIYPQPGLRVELETDEGRMLGIIRSVNSGRCLVDFNHPLADQTVTYKLKVLGVAREPGEKLDFLLEDMQLKARVQLEGGKVTIHIRKSDKSEDVKKQLTSLIPMLIPSIQQVDVVEEN